jgi:DNA-binding transcriptional MerR regulator
VVRVEQVARAAGVSPRMVRHYARSGLLRHARTPNGYRDFPEEAIGRIELIQRLLKSGLGLKDIGDLWPCLTAEGEFDGCDVARARLAYHVRRLEDTIEQHRRTLVHLRERQRHMSPR